MPTGSGVPTEVTNFTWSALFGLIAVLINGTAFGVWLKTRPATRKLDYDRESNLLELVTKRLEALEAKLEAERARHEAERSLDRHRINNMDQALNYLFLVFEKRPDQAAEVIQAVKEMRARHLEAEAMEKAAIHAAALQKTGAIE